MGTILISIGLLLLPFLILSLERQGFLGEGAGALIAYCRKTGQRLLRKGLKAVSASVQLRLAIAAIARTALNQGINKREEAKQRKRKGRRSSQS